MALSSPGLFEGHAQACREKADTLNDPSLKRLYLQMAHDWESLARLSREIARDRTERDRFFAARRASA